MDQFIPLESAALATGQSAERLRRWCATGKLRCEKQDTEWVIALSELPSVAQVVADHDRALSSGRAVAVLVPVTTATPDLRDEVARRLGLPDGSVSTSTLALDGGEYVIAVWKSDGVGDVELAPVADLAEQLGGELLDGESR